MKKIETDCGYREEYENGEIRYYSDWSGQGWCYKDRKAFEKGEGVCYIREAEFEHAKEDYGLDYVTAEQMEKEGYGLHTKREIVEEVRDTFKYLTSDEDFNPNDYDIEGFILQAAENCFNEVDWQGVDMLLDEWDWQEDLEGFRKS